MTTSSLHRAPLFSEVIKLLQAVNSCAREGLNTKFIPVDRRCMWSQHLQKSFAERGAQSFETCVRAASFLPTHMAAFAKAHSARGSLAAAYAVASVGACHLLWFLPFMVVCHCGGMHRQQRRKVG